MSTRGRRLLREISLDQFEVDMFVHVDWTLSNWARAAASKATLYRVASIDRGLGELVVFETYSPPPVVAFSVPVPLDGNQVYRSLHPVYFALHLEV